MLFVALTFAGTIALIFGTYWLLLGQEASREQTALDKRLKKLRTQAAKVTSVSAGPERMSAIPVLDALLRKRAGPVNHLQQLLVESGQNMTVGAFVLTILLSAAVGWTLGWLVIKLLSAALLLAVLLGSVPYLAVRMQRTKRLLLFEEQFPEALDLIARAMRAGHAFTTGLNMVAEEIPKPVGAEFRRVYDEQNFGMSLPDALRAMASRVPVLDARFFVTAVLTQREAGGNLSEVLDNLAAVMRERFKLKRQIRVISAHGRISAWVLASMPPALALVISVLSPGALRPLWEDPAGPRLIMVALLLQVAGTFIISRMVKIEY